MGSSRYARAAGGAQITSSLRHGFEKLVPFAQPAHADVLVFEHRFDDAQNRFGAQVIAMVESLDALKNLVLAQSRILQCALLETVAFDEVRLVFFEEPAVSFRLVVKLSAR